MWNTAARFFRGSVCQTSTCLSDRERSCIWVRELWERAHTHTCTVCVLRAALQCVWLSICEHHVRIKMKQKDDISVVDSILDEKGSDVHNVCDDDNYDDDKDDWGNVLRNCQIFTTFYEPLSANCVTL